MMSYMQRLGKSLMLPVSIVPIAAILKGIGYWIDPVGWGVNNIAAAFLIESGDAIMNHLPLLFAVGISIGMVKNKDVSVAISAVVAYALLDRILSVDTVSLFMNIPVEQVHESFQNSMNAFTGILIGLVCSTLYNHYYQIMLPNAFSFFSGKRFIPLISTAVMLVIAVILLFIGPFLYDAFIGFGKMISDMGPVGAGIYAFFNRLLIPTGLHHAINSVFWFDVAGIDDIGKFWGTIDGGVMGQTGMYQAGFFPIMMFGLPAAALAMIHCARPQKKKQVAAVLLSAAFASFLTGVTEPIEFSFMFVAPWLYVVHALLTGLFVFLAASFQWLAGFGFSAGLIDYVLSIRAPFSMNIFMLLPMGIICGIIYYMLFRFMILRYNLLTPGRESDEDIVIEAPSDPTILITDKNYDELAILYVEALGGISNILAVDNCITRLRVELKDMSLLNEHRILATGIGGIVKSGKNSIQIIIGPQVDSIMNSLNDILR